jgi:hypothetical protein
MLHVLLLALMLPATAIAVIGVIELVSKDDPEVETPDWVRPYPNHQRRPRH